MSNRTTHCPVRSGTPSILCTGAQCNSISRLTWIQLADRPTKSRRASPSDQDTRKKCDDSSELCWAGISGLQWEDPQRCAHNGGYGGTQARRVLAVSHPQCESIEPWADVVEGRGNGIHIPRRRTNSRQSQLQVQKHIMRIFTLSCS